MAAAELTLLCLAMACSSTRLRPGETAYVMVAGNGVTTFRGEIVTLTDLPLRLKEAGATPRTPIKIVAQGEISERLLKSIAGGLGRHGLRRVMIVGPREAAAVVGGEEVQADTTDDAAEELTPVEE